MGLLQGCKNWLIFIPETLFLTKKCHFLPEITPFLPGFAQF